MRSIHSKPVILLVDDEMHTLQSIKRLLRKLPVTIESFDSPFPALQYLDNQLPQLIITDQRMPGMTGIEMLSQIHSTKGKIHSILLSAFEDFDTVANAISEGVVDKFISKPWENAELKFLVERALGIEELVEDQFLQSQPANTDNFHGLISGAPQMQKVFDTIHRAATSNAPIFIHGETGTGKELVARACHWESFQNSQPFIPFNCANFSEHLMESQLFGHVKGAFTGATANQKGLFAAAQKGTIFLDEITTLPLPLQAKLLRVLQEREYTPVGSTKTEKFEAHVISASSTSLQHAVEAGDFREDLHYRLNVVPINLPPLRQRSGDIQLLANHFISRFNKIENKGFSGFDRDAVQMLNSYDWPGNVRQLENMVQNLVILNEGKSISANMLKEAMTAFRPLKEEPVTSHNQSQELTPLNVDSGQAIQPLWKTEKQAIEGAIELSEGNIVKAAALLEISPSTIYRKMAGWEEKGLTR